MRFCKSLSMHILEYIATIMLIKLKKKNLKSWVGGYLANDKGESSFKWGISPMWGWGETSTQVHAGNETKYHLIRISRHVTVFLLMWLDVVIFNGRKIDLPVYWASEDVLVPKDQVGRVVRRGRGQVARDSHLKGGHLYKHDFYWYPSVFLQKEEKNNAKGASCTNWQINNSQNGRSHQWLHGQSSHQRSKEEEEEAYMEI